MERSSEIIDGTSALILAINCWDSAAVFRTWISTGMRYPTRRANAMATTRAAMSTMVMRPSVVGLLPYNRPLEMPLRRLLVRMSCPEHDVFFKGSRNDLQADREPGFTEPAR